MVTRRIARNGMRGRKKISLLLILVLSFTFIFITTIVILETSMQQTKISQREQLYGTWQAAYLGADAAGREKFLAEPDVTEAVTSYLLGKDKNLGNVGTISPEMVQMGKLVVTQGRLPEEHTVLENILLPIDLDGKKQDMEYVDQVIDSLELREKLSYYPDELSGGQRQRGAIARAMAPKPAMILADEPTGNLDEKTSGEVIQLLKKSAGDFGQTIVLVTHDMEVAHQTDRVITIADGRIVSIEEVQEKIVNG